MMLIEQGHEPATIRTERFGAADETRSQDR